MTDRRTRSRRNRALIPEPLTRKSERRGDDRRDWLRKEIALDVREPGRKSRACMGDLSVGGASFITTAPPFTDSVQVMFTLPTYVGPIIASATVIARRAVEKGAHISVVFTDLDVEAELAIAQWFDEENPVVRGQEIIPLTQVHAS
jgi:hypothetical protein